MFKRKSMKEKQQRQLTVCRSYTHTHYTNSDDISDCSVKSARSNATWQKDSVHAWGEVHSRVFGQWRFVDRKWIGGMNEWKRAKSQWDEAKWSVFPSNIFYWSLTPPPPQPKKMARSLSLPLFYSLSLSLTLVVRTNIMFACLFLLSSNIERTFSINLKILYGNFSRKVLNGILANERTNERIK